MSRQDAFYEFEFELGQRVQHKVDGIEGIVVRRVLVQAQFHQNIGRMYSICYSPGGYADALEIELESAEEDAQS